METFLLPTRMMLTLTYRMPMQSSPSLRLVTIDVVIPTGALQTTVVESQPNWMRLDLK